MPRMAATAANYLGLGGTSGAIHGGDAKGNMVDKVLESALVLVPVRDKGRDIRHTDIRKGCRPLTIASKLLFYR